MESHSLLVTLVVTLVAALVGAALAARIGQSVILGYILAGIVIGPFTPGPVGDLAAVQALADVGIVFLMFAIGVQLSLRELVHAGRVAAIGGPVQILATLGLGFAAGQALGWRPLEALFLGAVISICSSAVLIKLLGERDEMDTLHGRIAIGWSAVQDLATVALVVVLSALAGSSEQLWLDLAAAVGRAALFLGLVAPVGAIVLPRLFERVAALGSREVFILTVAAVALGTAYVSTFFGLSLALGAFVAGVVVSESDLSHQILGEITPLRDIFAGLFFVSVGMLVDPAFVAGNLPLVLVGLALIVVAKGLITAAIIAVARYPLGTAIYGAVLLAQAGEFSFLLARLGVDLGVVSAGAFSTMLASAVASLLLAPLLYPASAPAVRWLEARRPLSPLTRHPSLEESSPDVPRGHAVLCGYGRVGSIIGTALERRGFRFVVVEQDQRTVRSLRARGIPALLGNAAHPVLLDRARLADARVLVVAIPDPLAARQVVDYARQVNRRLDIVVRTHSPTEVVFLRQRGVGEAVMGELELALEMTRHTLHRFGVSGTEVQAIVHGLREQVTSDVSFDDWELTP